MLFRRPRLDATSEAAQEWLDRILCPDDPPEVAFVVSIVSLKSYDGPIRGVWRGFGRGFWGERTLRIEGEDFSGATTYVSPVNLVSVEVHELRWERQEDEDWCLG